MGVLWERDAISAATTRLLDDASHGRGSALFVIAEPGLGKTTTVVDAIRRATPGFAIRCGRGDAVGSSLPFGLLAQVMPDIGSYEEGDRLGDSTAATARARQLFATLRWLEQVAQPMLLAFDDLHWADADSLALLSLLCRRIRELPVAVLATLRPWPAAADGLARTLARDGAAELQRLAPLSELAAAALLRARSGHSALPPVARQAWQLCAGNPLLLEQVALAIARGEQLPLTTGSGAVKLEITLTRFAGVRADAFRYAQAASVLGTRFRPDLAAEIAGLDERQFQHALEALHGSGVFNAATEEWVEFVHPLFRQALYRELLPAERSRLHRRAFHSLTRRGISHAEAAGHAVHGRMLGDPAAISVLERAGWAAMRAGATASAIGYLESAVDLAGEQASTGLLLPLGELLLAMSSTRRATRVYERALVGEAVPGVTRSEILRRLGRALCADGAYREAESRFAEAVEVAQHEGTVSTVEALLDRASLWYLDPRCALVDAGRARELAAAAEELLRARATMVWAFVALLNGDGSSVEAAEQAAVVAERHPEGERYWHMSALPSYHHLTRFTERFEASQRTFETMLSTAEQVGATLTISFLLIMHTDTLVRLGRLEESLALLRRAALTAEAVPPMASSVLAMANAHVLQLLGRLQESDAWWRRACDSVLVRQEEPTRLWLWHIRGQRRLREGRVEEASSLYLCLSRLNSRVGLDEPCAVPWARDAIRAHLAAGRPGEARQVLAWVERCSARLPCRWPRIVIHTARAAFAERANDPDCAEAEYRAALALHNQVPLALERIRTLVQYGTFLRRTRQPTRARELLADALALAEQCGAAWLAEEACEELHIAGGRRRRSGDPIGLTPQESRIARLAATGCSNADIARQLVISTKTVESHLHQAFAKLGIRSRRELPQSTMIGIASSADIGVQGP